jgi:hypothetical protein
MTSCCLSPGRSDRLERRGYKGSFPGTDRGYLCSLSVLSGSDGLQRMRGPKAPCALSGQSSNTHRAATGHRTGASLPSVMGRIGSLSFCCA